MQYQNFMILSGLKRSRYERMARRGKLYRYTAGFIDFDDFVYHFYGHSAEIGINDWIEFAGWVDRFCGGPKDSDTDECQRNSDGAILRYNNVSNVFGVLHADNLIGTCFRPDEGRVYFEDKCKD